MLDFDLGNFNSLPQRRTPQPGGAHFTARELEVLRLMAEGATSVEIAARLSISVHTVKNHRKNLLRKAHCRNAGQLIATSLARRII